MTIRLGTHPIAWSNDDDQTLGADISLETCLSEARQAGFTGIELGHKFPREPAALKEVLSAHGLTLVSGWHSGSVLTGTIEEEWNAMAAHRELLSSLGCKVMVFCDTTGAVHGNPNEPVVAARPKMSTAEWQPWADKLTALADRLFNETGIALAYHHHMGTLIQDEAEIDRLMELTGSSVGLLYDTGHLAFSGCKAPGDVAKRHADRIVHVHTKDIRQDVVTEAIGNNWSFLQAVKAGAFTVPGDGAVDFTAALSPVREHNGWMVVEAEQDPAKANPLTYARKGYTHLKAVLTELGVTIAE
jgi:inosose dehydratase